MNPFIKTSERCQVVLHWTFSKKQNHRTHKDIKSTAPQKSCRKEKVKRRLSQGDLWMWLLTKGVDYKLIHRKLATLLKELYRLRWKRYDQYKIKRLWCFKSLWAGIRLRKRPAPNVSPLVDEEITSKGEPRFCSTDLMAMENNFRAPGLNPNQGTSNMLVVWRIGSLSSIVRDSPGGAAHLRSLTWAARIPGPDLDDGIWGLDLSPMWWWDKALGSMGEGWVPLACGRDVNCLIQRMD